MISDKQKIPHYRKLYELLRKQIIDGVFTEGDILPSENELCVIHGLTRPTVRHALDALVYDGFIRKHQGKGSIVHKLPKGIGILSIAGTTSALGEKNQHSEILLKPYVRTWPENFMFRLSDTEINSGCIHMERLRFFNDLPIFYDINFLPNINLPRFTSRSFENRSLFDILRTVYRIEIKGGEQMIRALKADKETAAYLKVEAGHPVLHLERKFETNRPGYFIYSSLYCNTAASAVYGLF